MLPVVVGWFIWRRWQSPRGVAFAAISQVGTIPQARWPLVIGAYGRLLAMVAICIGLAGPRTPDYQTKLMTQSITMMLVLDTSGSMEEETFTWESGTSPITRREAAKRAFRLLIAGGEGPDGVTFEGRSTVRGTDAIGLVTFSTYPQTVCPPTLNHSVMLDLLDRVPKAAAIDTASNIGDSIAEGVTRLQNSGTKRNVIILLSDGEHNYDLADPERAPLKPREAARLAAAKGIPIYAIDTGGDPPEGDAGEQRRAGREVNQQVADLTGGQAFVANDGEQLRNVCQQIDQLERQPIISPVYRRYHDYTTWLVAFGLFIIVGIFVLEQTYWRRVD